MSEASRANLPDGAWIVLGFLLDGAGPRSGYDLQAQAARSVANFWPLTKAHVYAALLRLEAAGLVSSTHVEQTGLPDKRVYSPTLAGEEAFGAWLNEADLGAPKLRHPLLVKIFFGGALKPETAVSVLNHHEARCRESLARLTGLIERAEASGRTKSARFRLLAIRHGVISLEAELAWIAETRDAFGVHN